VDRALLLRNLEEIYGGKKKAERYLVERRISDSELLLVPDAETCKQIVATFLQPADKDNKFVQRATAKFGVTDGLKWPDVVARLMRCGYEVELTELVPVLVAKKRIPSSVANP